ncbi:queuine tRNA ribosyl transferase [Toxoplasma gondii GAB2-2007-GAL-DOM2]|uniref:Queuine tRNA ribosyl transferase n=4 Tax=Toxoplasma gondii TaxID=5811 RepID=V4Z7C5_TOXGV|nr:queuine tRNA ribosyl transferase [Toxoplasma gondii VEG]KFG32662.1 queuine tRNA ribosyl transferase [Toxoplasma gondii GAB2-2007-GAL-DOM2]KFG43993.1 queuine tRNA ribosyl transferase [Toxoplasma gondii p89]PUA88592.1 queuine tRNA ribosyl transferase [Toxoplasma gondii TgCATBr9]
MPGSHRDLFTLMSCFALFPPAAQSLHLGVIKTMDSLLSGWMLHPALFGVKRDCLPTYTGGNRRVSAPSRRRTNRCSSLKSPPLRLSRRSAVVSIFLLSICGHLWGREWGSATRTAVLHSFPCCPLDASPIPVQIHRVARHSHSRTCTRRWQNFSSALPPGTQCSVTFPEHFRSPRTGSRPGRLALFAFLQKRVFSNDTAKGSHPVFLSVFREAQKPSLGSCHRKTHTPCVRLFSTPSPKEPGRRVGSSRICVGFLGGCLSKKQARLPWRWAADYQLFRSTQQRHWTVSHSATLDSFGANSRMRRVPREGGNISRATRAKSRLYGGMVPSLQSGLSLPDIITGREEGSPKAGTPRVGLIRTRFGDVETPNFILCGTKATVKGITVEMLREANTQIILANTYHLLVYPGPEVIERLGGLQHFTGWHGPMFTDSGGYQIFSLHHGSIADEVKGRRRGSVNRGESVSRASVPGALEGDRVDKLDAESRLNNEGRFDDAVFDRDTDGDDPNSHLLRLDETGAVFRSYHTGQRIELTPERAMEAQAQLGADLIVALDECTPFHTSKGYTAASMRRSHRWALRCLVALSRLREMRGGLPPQFPVFYEKYPATSQPACRSPSCDAVLSGVRKRSVNRVTADDSEESTRFAQSISVGPRSHAECPICSASRDHATTKPAGHGLDSHDIPAREAFPQQGLYGVVQGGVYRDLREESVSFVNEHPFFGSAIGGSLGADSEQMHAVVRETAQQLRRDRPIHLLGIGRMRDIFHGVRQGIDTFDCVHPTRAGRHGSALVPLAFWEDSGSVNVPPSACWDYGDANTGARKVDNVAPRTGVRASAQELPSFLPGQSAAPCLSAHQRRRTAFPAAAQRPKEYVDLRNAAFKFDDRPILPNCGCYTCRTASRAYLHYLLKAGEQLGGVLVTVHNIFTMNRLMGSIRQAILQNRLDEEEGKWIHPLMRL